MQVNKSNSGIFMSLKLINFHEENIQHVIESTPIFSFLEPKYIRNTSSNHFLNLYKSCKAWKLCDGIKVPDS